MNSNKTNGNIHKSGCNGTHASKFPTKCIKTPGSFPSALLDTHPILANINNPYSSGGAPPTFTVRANVTSATATSSLTFDGGTDNLIQKMQAKFVWLSKTVTDLDIDAYFEQLNNT